MTVTAPSGARPRRGRPRHHDSPRARARARQGTAVAGSGGPRPVVAATQLTTMVEVDLTDVAQEMVLATVAAAAVRSTDAHPGVLGRVDPGTGTPTRSSAVHLAVLDADGTPRAVVEDAADLTTVALARRIAAGQPSDVGHTFAVVDTGSLGALLDTPLLGRDRSTVLGIGAVVRRPVVRASDGGEAIVVRAMAHLSLSYDPRLLGGGDAARFLQSVRHGLEGGAA